jgi:mannose-6-phosphate isomerase-like protein (cupin superfamily)
MINIFVCALMFAGLGVADSAGQRRSTRATATLAVVVTDTAGMPVDSVLVTVDGPAARTSRTERGRIVFEGIPPGAYRLRFEREGFVTLERELTARGGAPTDVKVTLTPAPPPPEPPPAPVEPEPAPPAPAVNARPAVFDLPEFIEQNYIGREPMKATPMACAGSGSATLIQVKDQLARHAHDAADEFLYVIAGDGSVQIADRTEPLQAGKFVMIPRGVPHGFAASGRRPLIIMAVRAGEGCGTR